MSQRSIKKYVFHAAAAKCVPVSGTFELTSRCNLNCRMCYIHMTPKEQQGYGKELTTEQWVDLGKQAVEAGMVYLLLTGGEPLLRPDFMTIYKAMVQMGVMVSINTNGIFITPEIVECLKQYPPEMVNVTLYGTSSETYKELCGVESGYEAAKRGILMLKNAGIRLNINTTFTKCNIADMVGLVTFAKENKIMIRTAAYVFPKVRNGGEEQTVSLSAEEHGKMAAQFDFLTLQEELLHRRAEYVRQCVYAEVDENVMPESKVSSCMAGRGSFWISWDGKMYPCGMLPEYSLDVTKTLFTNAWEDTCQNITQVFLPEECSVCQYKSLCPLCAAVTQSINGDTAVVPEEMCVYIKAYCKAFLEEYTRKFDNK